jgi:hypothetical protein
MFSYGLCSAMGFFYSAAHTVLPFMLLGIGIGNDRSQDEGIPTKDLNAPPAAESFRLSPKPQNFRAFPNF